MAGVVRVPGEPAQLRLIARLRWRIFVNSLRSRRSKFDLAGRIFAGVMIGAGAFGMGVLLGVGSWEAFHSNHSLILPAELWFVFLIWQSLPILITGFGAQADLGLLLRFPVRYSTFVLLTLGYGLMDPVAVAALYWLAAILVGIAVAAPGALLWAVPALAVFAVFNLLLNRAIFAWLDRWLAQRRTREILGVDFFLVMMSFQLIGPLSRRWGRRAVPAISRLEPIQRPFPPGLAAYAIQSGYRGEMAPALLALGGLVVLGAGFGWLLGIRLRAQYRGENLSEARAEPTRGERGTVHRGWRLAGLSPPVAALLEKDLRYLFRNTAQYVTLVVPSILVLVFSLNGGASARRPIFAGAAFLPMSVGYCMLVLAGFAYNNLGYDGTGVVVLFAAPVRFRDVLASKNLLHALLVAFEIALVSVLVCLVAGPPPLLIVALTLAGALFVIPLNFAAGNLVSLYFPKRLQFGTIKRQNASGIAVLLTVFVPATAIGIAVGVYALSRWAGDPWWGVGMLLVLAIAAFGVYRLVLDASSRIAITQREVLMTELCK